MSIDPINIGGAPNDGNGQNLRSGGQIINDNFAELDTRTAAAQARADQGVSDAAAARDAAAEAKAIADAAVPATALGDSVPQLINGVVPASQLPSFVDDVLEFPTLEDFPEAGETGKIYIAVNDGDSPTNPTRQYRWSGSAFVLIPSSPGSTDQVPEGPTNQYFTQSRVRSTTLSGLGALVNAAILATDTVLQAFAKLQGQLNAKLGKSDVAADSDKLGGQPASYYTATMTGATASADGVKGLVPAPPAGAVVRVLSSLGTWVTQASGGAWGAITGNLSEQLDLKAALDSKASATSVVITKKWNSGPLSWTAGGLLTLTHSLGVEPVSVVYKLQYKTAANGMLVGERELVSISPISLSGIGNFGVSTRKITSTSAQIAICGNGFWVMGASGTAQPVSASQADLIVELWA